MLRSIDDWAGEHFAFDGAPAPPEPTSVAIANGVDGPTATIPDAHLLFTAQFTRAGDNLLLHGEDGTAFVVQDYFASDDRARLLSPEGAALSPEVVAALAGPQAPGQYAQAGAPAPAVQAVGRVAQVTGDATIVRNGVAITANAGDAILKGDVLQTVSGTIGVTFNDGSTLNLTANTRLVVNEFVYDPRGSANSQLLDLVQGSLTFISGEVAHNGDMRIGTPVATMGIRGTVGGVTTANDGTVNFYVSQSTTGAVILDSRGTIIANVVQDGPLIIVRPVGPLQVLAEEVQKSPAQLATELAALQQIVSIQSVGQQIIQQFFQQDPNNNPNPNPQSTDKPLTQIQIDIKTLNGGNTDPAPGEGGNNNGTPPQSATVTIPTSPDNTTPPQIVEVIIPAALPPINFGPLNATVDEDGTLVFAGGNAISVFDADTPLLKVTLTATHGSLTLSSVAGLTFSAGDGTGDAAMTFSGTQAAINAALSGMSFTPEANYSGQASVKVTTSDGNTTSSETVAISVNPVNDPPVLGYFNLAVAEGGTTVLSSSDFHITDPDSSSFFFTVTNLTGGQFEVLTEGHWVAAPTGGFTVDDIAAGNVRFVHDGGNAAPTFTVWASDFTDAGPAISPTVDFTVVNHAPVITLGASGGPDQIQHDTSTGLALSSTDAVRGLATDGQLLYVNDGGAEIDVYTLAGSFVESHAVDNLAGNSNQMTFADGHLYARNYDTVYLISTQDWSGTVVSVPEDQGLLTSKEWMVGDLLSLPDGRVGVMGANEDDTTTLRLYTVGADGTSFTWSEDVILQTAGAPGDNHGSASDGTYIYILDNSVASYRSYSLATGQLVYDAANIVNLVDSGTGADLNNPTFITHDQVNGEYIVGGYGDPAVQLSGGNSNNILVAENMTAVTTVTASDVDAGTTLTYSIAGGADSELFDIDSVTGALSFKTAPDYEAPVDQGADNIYDVTVQVSDGALTDSKDITVTVTNVDDGPPAAQPGFANVSEEGLSHGIADETGDADTTDSTIAPGTIAVTGVGGQLTFTLGLPTTALSSGGHPISWALDDYGTLAGKVGAQTIITVSINDNGDYTVTLLGPVDHPDTNAEDVKDLSIPVNVSDGVTTTSTTLTVNVEDDSPVAANNYKTVVPGVATASVNIVIILDVSGSMDAVVLEGVTRLSLAKDALASLLNTDAAHVNQVMVVSFSGGANVYPAEGNHWTDAAGANSYIQGLQSGGGTNYDDATGAVISSWGDGPTQADKTLVYFISDGAPSSGHGLDATETAAWEDFLSTHGVGVANAIGISTNVNNPELANIAWAPENADLLPILLEQPTDLDATLQSTVPTAVTHNIFDAGVPVGFGADGGHIYSISVDGYTYTWDGNSTITKTGGEALVTLAGSSIDVTTELGGAFKFAFGAGNGHAAGDWSYTPPSDANVNAVETFHYVLVDNDGDQASADIVVTVDGIGNLSPVFANVAPNASYTENGNDTLLSPDLTVTDADSATLSSAAVKISGGHVSGDYLYADTGGTNIVTSFDGNIGVLRLSGSDTAAHYQQVLESVRFTSYSDDPTDGGATTSRTIDWQVGSSFAGQSKFDAGSNVYSMTTGDVNGDGKPDLVVSNIWDQAVSVLLGNGDGTFQERTSFPAGGYATGATIADMNHDGNADIVATNFYNNTVSVLLGAGDGTFQAPITQSTGAYAFAVAAADLDGDGNADIATANYYNNSISVLFGNGDGTFRDQANYATGSNPQFIAIADLDADGNLDLIAANTGQSTVSVSLGNGDGTFQNKVDAQTGAGPSFLLVADLNSDGKLDLVTADNDGSTVSVLFGIGDGTFGDPTTYATGMNPTAVALGDVNGDGKQDLITANRNDGSASVLLGNGDGTFQAQTNADVIGNGAIAAALVDLNGDGRPDLITANSWENTVSVLLGNDTNLSAVQHSTIDVTAVNDAPVNELPGPLGAIGLTVLGDFTLSQYLAVVPVPWETDWEDYQAGILDWMQNDIAENAADYTAQASVIDYSNDSNPWGDFPGFSYWPSNLDEGGQFDQFFALFTGKIFVSATDTYDFRYDADDGAVLLIDGELYSDSIELAAGVHNIELYFYDWGGGAIVEFSAARSGGQYSLVGSADAVASGADFAINGLSMYDNDAGDAQMRTTLSIGHGALTVSPISGATVTGSGTNTVVITGDQWQIDDTLREAGNIVYTSASNFSGTDTLTMTTTDFGHTGTGGAQTTVSTLDVFVDAPPLLLLDHNENATYVQNDVPLLITFSANLITDADDSQLLYASVKINNAQAGDFLSVIGNLPSGITATAYNAVSGALTLYGLASHAAYQAALAQVAFSNSTDFPGGGDRIFEVTVSDGSASSNLATVTINVIDTDDPPIASNDNLDSANAGLAGFTLNPDNGHWYRINTDSLNWASAQAAAIAAGGYLATITSAGENAFIDNLRQAAGGPMTWIGASDAATEGHWVWVGGPENGQQFWQGLDTGNGGTALDYANWNGGEPNDSGSSEDAAHMQDSGIWNDMNAGNQLASVIEASFFVEDRASIISAESLLANDRDEGVPTINSVDDTNSHGTVTMLENGDIQYVPDANFYGADSFTYTLIDAGGHVSNPATVNFTVAAVDDTAISWTVPAAPLSVAFDVDDADGGVVEVNWGDEASQSGGASFNHSYGSESDAELVVRIDDNVFASYHIVAMPSLEEGGSNGYVAGTAGNDILIGNTEAPQNTFDGNAGDDVMFATASIDTFMFESGGGKDIVVGFNADSQSASQDIIDISDFGIYNFNTEAMEAFLDSAVDTPQGLQFVQGSDSLLLAGVHSITLDNLQGVMAS